jgi:chromosome segregation protein
MPKLKRLDLQGFKSFADPLTLLFPTGITAIVGPNGSGKSNVADAVRWVLGEQRMTTIRGRTGEDMIFAGSKKRPRSGMARASLTFDNADGWLPVDFAEVTVERRTYRDGKTDYMLNGSKVRLMDLQDMLDRAGLGRDAYLFIGQGLVDQVLSLRPQERLAIFEQAAGIVPYRSRREDAVKRLADTQHNLERVYDIVGEIEPRLRRLKRQVARAEQHADLTRELNTTLRTWYGYRWGRAVAHLEQARQRVAYHEKRAFRRLETLEAISERITAQRQRIADLRARLETLHRESAERHAEAGQHQRELAVARERRRQMRERHEETQANLVPLRSALAAEREDIAALEGELDATATRLEAARERLASARAAHDDLERRRHTRLSAQSQAQARALEIRHRLADRQSRREQAAERLTQLDPRIATLREAVEAAAVQRREQQAAVSQARRVLEEAEAALTARQSEEAEAEADLAAAREAVEGLRRDLGRQRAALEQVTARRDALERLHAEGAGLYAGVRATLQAVERGDLQGLPGTVASLIRVPPELDRAMATALGSQLQNIVADRWDDARAAIAWLKRRRAGRATFLPLDTLRPPSLLRLPGDVGGVIGVAAELIDYEARYRPAVRLLLGRVAVTEDLPAARALHRRLRGGFRIVTLEGEIVRSGGAVTGGETRNAQGNELLARERERRELPRRIAALERERDELQEALQRREAKAQALAEAHTALTARRREAERRRQTAERALERALTELDQRIQAAAWQRQRLEEAEAERERLAGTDARLRQEQAAAEAALAEVEARLAELERELAELSDDEVARAVASRRTEVALLEQEHENQRVLLTSRQREARRLAQQIAAQETRVRTLDEELTALATRVRALQTTYEAAQDAADALSARIPPLQSRLEELEQALTQQEAQEQEARRRLREAEQRLSQSEVDANRREDQVRALHREIEETLGIVVGDLPDSLSAQQPLPLAAIVSPLPAVQELPEGLEAQIRDLRTQIRRLEPVHVSAQEEYAELNERYGFMREQMEDLETASAHLRQVIVELDEMMSTMFNTTFKAVAKAFSDIFQLLFNGGRAKLEQVREEDEIVGVEIMARPPGKRTSGLGMLSGGERTLTAVALLFAVMRVSPTPFCLLDEVDAMLDEANVGRFRSMLRELSRRTQFLVITHNRGTVEAADTIYGVSMGDDGVSQVLSLSLEDLPPSEAL